MEEIEPSLITNDPGECSRHSLTTPRRRRVGNSARTADRTADTPPGLWLPRPVITSTSVARLICRSRSQASARCRASAPVGNDSRRFRMFFTPNSASSNALSTGWSDALLDRILKYVSVESLLWSYAHDRRESWGHVYYPGKLRVVARLHSITVEDYRHMRVRIVRTAMLGDEAGEPIIIRRERHHERRSAFVCEHVQPPSGNLVIDGIRPSQIRDSIRSRNTGQPQEIGTDSAKQRILIDFGFHHRCPVKLQHAALHRKSISRVITSHGAQRVAGHSRRGKRVAESLQHRPHINAN